jgi:hypothetical protein
MLDLNELGPIKNNRNTRDIQLISKMLQESYIDPSEEMKPQPVSN